LPAGLERNKPSAERQKVAEGICSFDFTYFQLIARIYMDDDAF
jgi:hypothetical protein